MSRISEYHKQLFEAQERTVRFESEEEITEEQVQVKCAELRNRIIDQESINNRFRNPKLHAIWNSPPRFKKL